MTKYAILLTYPTIHDIISQEGSDEMISINEIRHAWPEKTDFCIDRPKGHGDWTFIHFEDPVLIRVNGEEYVTEPHSCIIYSPFFPQYYKMISPIIHDWFHFVPNDINIFSALNIPIDQVFRPKRWDFISRAVKDMELEFFSKMPHSEALIGSLSTQLFINFSRDLSGNLMPAISPEAEPRLRRLRASMFSALSHQWTVNEMAAYVGLSPSRFFSVYRSAYGTSPMNDLIYARVNAAKEMLYSSSKTIADISESLGYNNITHFMRQFHLITGTTPKKYRESSRSGL
jgi:AraC family transcriptional regulator of arabinose operon